MSEARIIIAGSRNFYDLDFISERVTNAIHALYPTPDNIVIISGHARGVDKCGEEYAKIQRYDLVIFPANWKRHGNNAGPERNRRMAEYATHLIAFRAPDSRGTKSMIDIARGMHLPTIVVDVA